MLTSTSATPAVPAAFLTKPVTVNGSAALMGPIATLAAAIVTADAWMSNVVKFGAAPDL